MRTKTFMQIQQGWLFCRAAGRGNCLAETKRQGLLEPQSSDFLHQYKPPSLLYNDRNIEGSVGGIFRCRYYIILLYQFLITPPPIKACGDYPDCPILLRHALSLHE